MRVLDLQMLKPLFGFVLVFSANANAEIYRCVQNGKAIFSDKPCDSAGIIRYADPSVHVLQLKEGQLEFDKGNYKLAFEKLNPLSEKGVAMAQNLVGRMYFEGQGVEENPVKALSLFRQAANQGLANAQNNMGVIYSSGRAVPQDYKQAFEWFKRSADQGFGLSMENLAEMYESGLGVIPNRAEAEKWRKRAQGVSINNAGAPVKIETIGKSEYEQGMNFYHQWSFKEAFEWLQKAAIKGHPEAQLRLALMHRQGQGTARNEAQSRYWEQRAREGAHTMNDNRDRVIIIEAPPGGGGGVAPAPVRPKQ